MNKIYQDYEARLDNILNTIRNSNENTDIEENEDIEKNKDIEENKDIEKNKDKKGQDRLKCKQFDTINYCYEMYKVRKNKKG